MVDLTLCRLVLDLVIVTRSVERLINLPCIVRSNIPFVWFQHYPKVGQRFAIPNVRCNSIVDCVYGVRQTQCLWEKTQVPKMRERLRRFLPILRLG